MEPKYKILIIDDNPFPTREFLIVLLKKLEKHFEDHFDKVVKDYYCESYNDLSDCYKNIVGKKFTFKMEQFVSISIYNYNASKCDSYNQSEILKIIKEEKINVFWCDREVIQFSLCANNFKESDDCSRSSADNIFKNEQIVKALIKNGVLQTAVYSYNSDFSYLDIDSLRDSIFKEFENELEKENIYVLEMSTIFNLFNNKDKLAPLNKTALGTLEAFKNYGNLLGSVLFDLFLQISENKISLSNEQKRYNYFNLFNRNFLRYFRLLNSNLINKFEEFNIGMISFYGNIFGQKQFIIDVPYKNYYQKFDNLLHKGENPIDKVIEVIETDEKLDSKNWLYYIYNKNDDDKFDFYYEIQNSDEERKILAEKYLPLLHTGIFYQPDFYEIDRSPFAEFKALSFAEFKALSKDEFLEKNKNEFVEIIYLFKKVIFAGFEGVAHMAVWRRTQPPKVTKDIKKTVEKIWENYFGLVEPKLEATIVSILKKELQKQATGFSISKVNARNTSHNIGAHVMNMLIDKTVLSNLDVKNDVNFKKNYLAYNKTNEITDNLSDDNADKFAQIAIFNNYVKCRMDYLADVTFGTPQMQTNKYAFNDLFKELDKVRLLLEHITGLSNFQYEIKFLHNGEQITDDNDLLVAIPNDILGMQAFYNILENFIRNSAKHAKTKPKLTTFTVNFKDKVDESLCEELKKEQENILQELIIVEIYDNIIIVDDVDSCGSDKEHYNYKTILAKQTRKPLEEIKPPTKAIDWLVFNQNERINADVLDKTTNQLRTSSLGVIEMDASAAYLRKRDVSLINHEHYDVQHDHFCSTNVGHNKKNRGLYCRNFLKAFKKDNQRAHYAEIDDNGKEIYKDNVLQTVSKTGPVLGYRFFILKPQVVLVITDEEQANKDQLKKNGIWLIKKEAFIKDLQTGKTFAHEFVVHTEKIEVDTKNDEGVDIKVSVFEEYKTSLTLRVLEVEDKKDKTKLLDLIQNVNNNKIASNSSPTDDCKKDDSILNAWETFCWDFWLRKRKLDEYYVNKSINFSNVNQLAIINHIGEDIPNEKKKKIKDAIKNNSEKRYIDALSSKGQQQLPFFKKLGTGNLQYYLTKLRGCNLTHKKIIESAINKIIIIDERIQYAAKQEFIGIEFFYLFQSTNIIIPNLNTIDLGTSDYYKIKPDIELFIKNNIDINTTLLIHYSILERIYENETNKIDAINTELDRLSKLTNVVITSGRGVPTELTSTVRFVNLSSIITATSDIRSKYLLNNIIQSSRKTIKL